MFAFLLKSQMDEDETFEFWRKVICSAANELRLCPRFLQLSLNHLVIGHHLLFFQLTFASES